MHCRVALLVVPFMTLACVANENNTPPGVDASTVIPDSGGIDATVTDSGTPDTAPLDAGVDAGPQTVTLTVLGEKGPKAGVSVVFGDGAGAVIATETTDATGRASHLVPAGSQVTAVLGVAEDAQLVTIVGVEPGDTLTAIDPTVADSNLPLTITALPLLDDDRVANYTVNAGACSTGFATPPGSMNVYSECQSAGRFPLLARAYDGNGKELAFVSQKGNAMSPDGGVPDGGSAPLAISGTWSTTVTTQTLAATNAPADMFPRMFLTEVADGVPLTDAVYFDLPDGGAASADFTGHPGYPDFVQRETSVRLSAGAGVSSATIATRAAGPAASGTTTFDLTQLLPRLTAATIASTAAGRPTVSWASTSPLTVADGALVELRWYTQVDGGGYVNGRWTLIVPPSATSVQAPALPDALAAFAPAADASFTSPPSVSFLEGSFVTGYAQLRSVVANVPPTTGALNDNGGPYLPPLPVDGTMRLSTFSANGD